MWLIMGALLNLSSIAFMLRAAISYFIFTAYDRVHDVATVCY